MNIYYKKPQTKKSNDELKNAKVYEIPYSEHFRGFKKFYVKVHGDTEAEKNNEYLYNQDLSSMVSRFICFDGKYGRAAYLYVDKYKIGTIYDEEQIYAIEHKKIEKIHYEPKEEVVIGKRTTEKRHTVAAIVKYKE